MGTNKKNNNFVYFFGNKKADGKGSMKEILGGKGAGLAEMTEIGINVPPGFTISTEVCGIFYDNKKSVPKEINQQIEENVKKLEKMTKKNFGDAKNPLLVSVRSGAMFSMPGMMDTILNLGLNDKTVLGVIEKSKNARFGWDSYRRFIQMFSDVVLKVDKELFEDKLEDLKRKKNVKHDVDLDHNSLKSLVQDYKKIVKSKTGKNFPAEKSSILYARERRGAEAEGGSSGGGGDHLDPPAHCKKHYGGKKERGSGGGSKARQQGDARSCTAHATPPLPPAAPRPLAQ